MDRLLPLLALLGGAFLLPGCGSAAGADEPAAGTPIGMKVRLDVEVLINGTTTYAPSIVFLAGEAAETRIEEEGLEPFVLRVDEGMMVHVRTPVRSADGALAGTPEVTMRPGQTSQVEFSVDGTDYVVEIRSTPHYLGGVDAR